MVFRIASVMMAGLSPKTFGCTWWWACGLCKRAAQNPQSESSASSTSKAPAWQQKRDPPLTLRACGADVTNPTATKPLTPCRQQPSCLKTKRTISRGVPRVRPGGPLFITLLWSDTLRGRVLLGAQGSGMKGAGPLRAGGLEGLGSEP